MENNNPPIRIDVAQDLQPAADLTAVFKVSPEKPAVGQPGKQAGDILLVEKPEGGFDILVSLGAADKLSPEIIRRAGGALGRWLLDSGAAHVDLDLDSLQKAGVEEGAEALLEGIRLGAYRFDLYKKPEEDRPEVRLTLRGGYGPEENQVILDRVSALTAAVLLARTLAHQPANVINPQTLAKQAQAVAQQHRLRVTILDEKELAQKGAGAILAVGQGSRSAPRLIVLEYGDTGGAAKPVVLVGKALTFDSGGYSLKSSEGIVGMKYDKCGGVDVLATLQAAADLEIGTPVVGIIAAAENMVSSEAYRPDDIITSLSGKTIEIISTDAEGRLVLADALTYAQRHYQPRALIDLATLTGGVVTALGRVRAGIMANNDELAQQLIAAGEETFERLWRLPLDEEYVKNMQGEDADLKNSGGREGHPVLGGAFLSAFVDPAVPWAHLDIAGVSDVKNDLPYSPKGATGFGVRLLIRYLERLDESPSA